jgi:UDP-glucose 4-epimerase
MNSLRAVVTGATGFIGSKLCEELLIRGWSVYAIIRADSKNQSRLPIHPNLFCIEGSMDSVSQWGSVLKGLNNQFQAFYHLAWEGVGNSLRNDSVQFGNLNPTLETVKLAKELGCNQWIGTGSQAEYGPANIRISEDAITRPTTLYGASKLSAGLLSQIWGRELGIYCQWVRVFSTYGPGDNGGWMLTDVIKHLLAGTQPKLTLGEQLWDYLYVNDAAKALVSLAVSNLTSSGVYNLGYGKSQPIRKIVEIARDQINPSFPLVFGELPYRPDQVMHLEANIDKLQNHTGWVPKTDLVSGIKQTIEYIKQNNINWGG